MNENDDDDDDDMAEEYWDILAYIITWVLMD